MADQQDKKPTGGEVTDSVASPEESKRDSKLSWMQFFDNEKYRHHLMLIKTRQYKELLSVLRQGSTNPDNYKPPIELPSPEEVFPPCDNADDDITNSQSGLYMDFSETSSHPTLSTGSTYSTQNSTTEGKHNRRLTIVLVLFGLTVLVGMSVTLGVILHVRSDKEESSLSKSRTDDVNKLEDVYLPSHPQSSTESLSAHQSSTSETPQWFKSSLLQDSQSTLSHFSLSPLANLLSTPPMTFSSNSKPANPQMFKPSTFALPRLSTTTLPSSFELVSSSSLFRSTSKPVSQYYSSTLPNLPMSSLLKMLKSPLPIDRPPVLSEILLQPPTPPVTRLSVLLQTQWSAPSMPNKDTYVPSLFQSANQPLFHMTPPSHPQISLSALPALSLSGTSSAEKQDVLTYPNSQSSTSSHQNSQMQKISSHHQLVNSPPATDSLSHLSVSSPSKSWKTSGPQKSISTLSGLSPESIPKMYRSAISQLATTRKPIIIVTLKQFQSTIPAPLMSKTERIYNPHNPHFLKQSIARGFISSIPIGSTHSPGYDFREPHLNTFRIPSSNSFGQGSRHLQLKPFGMPTSSDPAVVTPSDSLRPHFLAPVQSEWIQSTTKTPPRMLYSPSQISGPARLSHPSSDGSHNYMSKMTLPVTATLGGATVLKTKRVTNTTSPISEEESQTLKETSGHEFVLSEIRTSLFDKAAGRPTKEVFVTTERPQGATASVITLLFSHTGSVPAGDSAHEAITTSVLTQHEDNAHMSIGSNPVEMFKLRKQTSFPFSVASTIRPAPSSLQKGEGNEGNISDDITELVNMRRSNVSSSYNNVSTFGNYHSSKSSLGKLPNRQDGHLGGALDTSSSMYPDINLTVLTEQNRVGKYTHTLVNTTSNPQNAATASSSESISSSSRHEALNANNDVVASYLKSLENAGMNRTLASAETVIKQSSILGMALSSSETKVTKPASTTNDNSNDMRILNTSYGNLYNTGDMATLYANNMTSFVGTQVDSNPYHRKVTPTVAGSDPADSGDVSQIDQGINDPTNDVNRDNSTSNTRNIIQSGDASRDNSSPSNTRNIIQSGHANRDNNSPSNTRNIIQPGGANRDNSTTSNTKDITQSDDANTENSGASNTRNIIQYGDANRDGSSTYNTRNIIQSDDANRDGSSTSNTRNIIQSDDANRDGNSTSNTRNIIQSDDANRDGSSTSNTRNIIQYGDANRDGNSTSNTRNIIQSDDANRDGSSTSNTRNIIQSGHANRDGSTTSNTRNIIQSDDANRDGSITSNTRKIIQSGVANRDGSSTSNTRNIIQSDDANRDGNSTSNTRNIIQSDDANRDGSSTSNTRNITQSDDANTENSGASNTRNIIQYGDANRDGSSTSNTRNIIQSDDANRDGSSTSNTRNIIQSDDANRDGNSTSNTRNIIQSDDANRDGSSTSNTRNIIQYGDANRDGSSTSNTRNIIQSDDANRDGSSTSNTRNIIQSDDANRDGNSTSNTRNIIQSDDANRDGSSTSNTRNIIQSGHANRDGSTTSNTRNIIQSDDANRDGSITSNTRKIIQSGVANRDGSSTSNTRNIIQSDDANRDGSSTSNTRNIIQSDDANRDGNSTSNTRNIIQSGDANRDGSSTSNTRNIIQSGVANRDGSSTSNTRNITQSDDANRDGSSTSNTRNIIQSGVANRDGSSTSNTRNIIQSGHANRDGSSTSNTRNIIQSGVANRDGSSSSITRNIFQSGDAGLASMLAPLSSTVAETQNPEGGPNRESELVMAISNQTSKSTETSNQLSIGTINRQPMGTPDLNHQWKETSNQHSQVTSYQPLMGTLNKQSTKMPHDQLVGASTHLVSTETPNYSLRGSTNQQSSKTSNQHSVETSDQQLTEALHQRFIGTSHEKSIGTSSQQSNGTSTQHSSETSHQQIIGTPHQLLTQAVGISNEHLRKTSNQESIETQNQSLGGSINVLSTGPSIQQSNGSIYLLSNQTSNQQTLGILNQQSSATSNQPTRERSNQQATVTSNNQTRRPLNRTSMTTSSQQFRNTANVESIEKLNQQSLETSNQQSTAPLNQQSLGTSNQQFVGTTNQHSSRTTNQKSSGTLNQQSRKTSFSKDNSKLPPAIVIWDKSTPLSTSNKTLSKSRVTSIKSEDEVHVSSTKSPNSKTIQTIEAVTRRRSETKANTIQTPKTVSVRSSVTKSKIPLPNTKREPVVTTVRNIKYPKVPQTNATTKESSSSRETTSDRNISASNATTNTSTATTATTPTATTTTATTTGATTTTLDPFASYQGVGNPDGGSGLSLSDLESALKKDGLNNQGVLLDYSLLLQNLPPPETLPRAMATKIAAKPPPIPTARPPLTPKPPEIKIIAPDVVAEIGMSPTSNLKVVCTAQKAWGWTYIAISRYEGDSEFSLEFLGGVDKKDEWPFIPIDSRMSDFTLHRDDDQVTFALETKYALCEDKGRYLCEVKVNRTFFSKTFNVDVKKRPEQPDLKFPEDVFEGQNVWLVTTWDAGNPVIGYIVHDIVQGFTGLPYAATSESSKAWYKDCAVMIENRYSVTPELSWNGTEIIAHILPKENATIYERSIAERVKYDRKIMTVLDKNICGGQTSVQIAHPYRSDKYITCYSSGPAVTTCPSLHVFDEITKVCVRSQIHH